MKLILKLLYFKSSKQLYLISIITLLILTIVFTSLISSNSMINSMESKIASLEDGHIRVDYSDIDFSSINLSNIKSIDKITTYPSILYSKDLTTEIGLKRVESSYFNKDRLKDLNIKDFKTSNKPSIILSKDTCDKLNVNLNDKIYCLVINNNKTKIQGFTITNIYNTTYPILDTKIAYVLNCDKLDSLNVKENYYILLNDKENIKTCIKELKELDPGIYYTLYYQIHKDIYSNFTNSKNALNLVFALLLLFCICYIALSSFNIASDNSKEMVLLNINGLSSLKISLTYSFIISLLVFILEIPAFLLSLLIVKLLPYILSSSSVFDYYIKDFSLYISYSSILIITISFILLIFLIFTLSFKHNIKKSVKEFILGI